MSLSKSAAHTRPTPCVPRMPCGSLPPPLGSGWWGPHITSAVVQRSARRVLQVPLHPTSALACVDSRQQPVACGQ